MVSKARFIIMGETYSGPYGQFLLAQVGTYGYRDMYYSGLSFWSSLNMFIKDETM